MSAIVHEPVTAAAPPRAVSARGSRLGLIRDRILLFAVIVGGWEAISHTLIDPLWISRPSLIAERLFELALSGELWRNTQRTLTAAALGLGLAFAVGLPVGIAMARYKYGHAVAEPFIMALHSLPRVALAPLFIIWFGIDLFSKVMMAFSTVVFIFMLNVHEGLKTVDRDLLDLLRTMKAPRSYVTRRVLLPWLVPWLIASLKIGVGLALIGAVVGELIGSSAGLGWYIERSAGRLDTTGVFAGLVLLMAIAVAGNIAVSRIERRFSSWRPT
ncbi:MAG: ABC transporter permease [Microvirga sp.]|nr:ABC transporter permease [Microvirga sp.]